MEALNSKESTGTVWQLKALNEALNDLIIVVEDELTIGRGKDNNVVLGSKSISRNHAQLKVIDDVLQVVDLGSSNGTFVNDQQIQANEAHLLSIRDVVSFATFKFEVSKQQNQQAQPVINESAPVAENDSVALKEDHPRSTEEVDISNQEHLSNQLEQELEEPIPVGDPDQDTIDATNQEAKDKLSNAAEETKSLQNEAHFKELAEESDPDVLKAKQAATTKLEGTVNIDKDSSANKVDETFNTVSEQKQHNVAHVNRDKKAQIKTPERKSNAIWWILLILLALAAALWLFNSGQMS